MRVLRAIVVQVLPPSRETSIFTEPASPGAAQVMFAFDPMVQTAPALGEVTVIVGSAMVKLASLASEGPPLVVLLTLMRA